jgi:hypothetical protein
MQNIHLLTVATHNEGYYDALKISAKRNNYTLETLGWGQKWEGFVMKMRLCIEKVQSFNDNDIAIMIDAYDVIILEKKEVLVEKFKKFKKPILLSRDGYISNFIFKYLQDKVYHNSNNYRINAGLLMGYVWALKKMYTLICGDLLEKCRTPFLDDQILLINTYHNHDNKKFFKEHSAYDYNSEVFFNTYGDTTYPDFNFEITDIFYIENNKLYLKNTDINPCIIQGPGNANLNSICNFYNLPIPKKISRDFLYRINMYTKPTYLYKFSDLIMKIKLFIIVLLLTFTGLYLKEKYLKKKYSQISY